MDQITGKAFDRENPDNKSGAEERPARYRCNECGHVFTFDQLIPKIVTFGRELVCPDCLGDVKVIKK